MLVAKVTFSDVDGNDIQKHYRDFDVNGLLERISYKITDDCDFPKMKNKLHEGINGVIDTTKPINIEICHE